MRRRPVPVVVVVAIARRNHEVRENSVPYGSFDYDNDNGNDNDLCAGFIVVIMTGRSENVGAAAFVF